MQAPTALPLAVLLVSVVPVSVTAEVSTSFTSNPEPVLLVALLLVSVTLLAWTSNPSSVAESAVFPVSVDPGAAMK